MLDPTELWQDAAKHLKAHPELVGRAARAALRGRFGVPVLALAYLAKRVVDPKQIKDLELRAVEPGLRCGGTIRFEGAWLRAGATIYIDQVDMDPDRLRFVVRVEQISLEPLDGKKTQLGALLKARALDLSRPGDLIPHLPGIPPVVVDAAGNRLSVDLLRHPPLARDPRIRHAVALLSSMVALDGIETEQAHLDTRWTLLPRGWLAAADALADHLFVPGSRIVGDRVPEPLRSQLMRGLDGAVALIAGPDPREETAEPAPQAGPA